MVDAGGVYLENATSFLPNINRFFLEGATTTNGRNKRQCESAPNWGKKSSGVQGWIQDFKKGGSAEVL